MRLLISLTIGHAVARLGPMLDAVIPWVGWQIGQGAWLVARSRASEMS